MRSLLSPLRLILVGCLLVAAALGLAVVPADTLLPVHWDAAGEANGFAPRNMALLVPLAICAFVWVVFALTMRFGKIADLEAGRQPIGVTLTGLTAIALLIEGGIVLVGFGVDFNMVRAVTVAVGLLLAWLGTALPKTGPNSVAGIRTSAALRDPANWAATHKLVGWLWLGCGLLLALAGLLLPVSWLVWGILVCGIVPALVGVAYSFNLARRRRPS